MLVIFELGQLNFLYSVCDQSLSHVRLFATPWTVAHQASLSLGFPRQEYWNGLPFPSPRDLPDPSDWTWVSWLAGRFFTTKTPGKPTSNGHMVIKGLNERKSEEAWGVGVCVRVRACVCMHTRVYICICVQGTCAGHVALPETMLTSECLPLTSSDCFWASPFGWVPFSKWLTGWVQFKQRHSEGGGVSPADIWRKGVSGSEMGRPQP